MVVKLDPSGRPDPSFAGDGFIENLLGSGFGGYVGAIATRTDGGIVVAGSLGYGEESVFVAVLRADGSFDPSFAQGGVRTIDVAGGPELFAGHDLQLLDDGGIQLGVLAKRPSNPDPIAGLVRLTADGSDDLEFGRRGRVLIPDGVLHQNGSLQIFDVCFGCVEPGTAIDRRGRTWMTGASQSGSSIALARVDASGRVDRNLGNDGTVLIHFPPAGDTKWNTSAGPVVARPDGGVVIAGQALGYSGPVGVLRSGGFAFASVRSNGHLDTGFSRDGRLIADFAKAGGEPKDLDLMPDGGVLAGGYGVNAKLGSSFAAVRLHADGSRSRGFGARGALLDVGAASQAAATALDASGRILLAGFSHNRAVVARYLGS